MIDRCIGAADQARKDGLKRLVIPAYWLVDVPALTVRLPWLILEKGGPAARHRAQCLVPRVEGRATHSRGRNRSVPGDIDGHADRDANDGPQAKGDADDGP
jgi:hypothetical protein